MNFIDEQSIKKSLECSINPSPQVIRQILSKALLLKGLDQTEAAALLQIEDDLLLHELFDAAFKIKNQIYGNRLVLFAPLYVSNYCSNDCLYCAFRRSNLELKRVALSEEQIKKEVEAIESQGHKRILMLMGEDFSAYSFEQFLKAIEIAYSVKSKQDANQEIRRINVEIPPLSIDQFNELKKYKIGTYTVFQETYHEETYREMHPKGMKSDYLWRLGCMDRALKSGINDVGIGVLFGLYDYKFEVLALLMHADHLDKEFGTGPHTISIPRIEPAQNAPAANKVPNPVSDKDFKKLVAVIRCAVPYTGMILSTREKAEMRQELFELGVSQISAGSRTNIGGYSGKDEPGQFSVGDSRPAQAVINDMIQRGFIPSFCTACYRLGRTGKDFMDLAKPGLIQRFCQPNALLTLQEYLEDFADDKTKELGKKLIETESQKIKDGKAKELFDQRLEQIKNGSRDLYF